MDPSPMSRRQLLKYAGDLGIYAMLRGLLPGYAISRSSVAEAQPQAASGVEVDLELRETPVRFHGREGTAMTINGTLPGPLIRLREGEDATIRVTNHLGETASIHWHGILLPAPMDGVPGVSFAGIHPGETFVYRFPVKQYGTYWYHSHSGGQEQLGVYGPLIIDPLRPDPFRYEREHVIVLSDWSFMPPMTVLKKLKQQGDYFNFQQLTLGDVFARAREIGWSAALAERLMWTQMRMDPSDILDVTGAVYTYLINGMASDMNWTGLFQPGERIRLRFIGAGAQTIFDVRIMGMKMTVVQADGQNVQPVDVDEFRIAPGETYDVIVEPPKDQAYTLVAEPIDRSGIALGTLAPRMGMRGPVPERRKRPLRSMEDMGMAHSAHGSSGSMPPGEHRMPAPPPGVPRQDSSGGHTAHPGAQASSSSPIPGADPVPHGPETHGPGNAMVPAVTRSRLHEPGVGLESSAHRVLVYTDLKSVVAWEDQRLPEREIELHLTGNMERFMWSIDGKKYSEAPAPIPFRFGERLRLTMVNDTMMEHPMHLHGMWMYLENGNGHYLPRKHTIIVKPAERLSVAITADAPGPWAFHCHMLLHMEVGMFRVVEVVAKLPEERS